MELKSQAHEEQMAMFEKTFSGRRLDRENKSLWRAGRIYQDGLTNELFLAFRHGVAYGLAVGREASA